MEPIVFDLYIKTSINKLLSLVERLQNLKQSIIDFSKNKYNNDLFIDKTNDNSNYVIKTENNITDNNYNYNLSSVNKKEKNENFDIEYNNMKADGNVMIIGENNFNNNKMNTIDCDMSLHLRNNNRKKTTKRGFSSIKKQKINYNALEMMKNEDKNDTNNENDNHNNNNNNLQKRILAKSAKRLTIKKKKYLYIEPVEQKERAGSVDVFKLNKHNRLKNENKIKDAMFIIDKYYTLDGIKKRIEKNKKKINIINKIYKNNMIKCRTIKKEENIDENQSNNSETEEEQNKNRETIHKTIVQDEYNNNCLYKNINLRLDVKNNFPKSKSINGNKKIYIRSNADNDLIKNKINLRGNLFKINTNDSNNKNNLIISHNYLFSSPSKLPKLNIGFTNNNNLNMDFKDCASNSIIDKMIEKTKKAIIPKIVKNFYENKKNKGYISFITNKQSNTIFLKKYGKKYDSNELYKNNVHTEENGKYLPKIYK